ncbi:MAG TPA: hypothetical protein VG455_02420 [Acidimicrobiales bacterium]|nr:hypothetical protein [Acidimicrobiales bacterium]
MPTGPNALPATGVVAGVVLALALLFVPVRASFGDDPILRLQGFDRQRSFLATSVSCGPAPSNLIAGEGTRSLYEVARDAACHRAGVRRVWLAAAVGSVLVVGGFLGMVATARWPAWPDRSGRI